MTYYLQLILVSNHRYSENIIRTVRFGTGKGISIDNSLTNDCSVVKINKGSAQDHLYI